MNICKAIIPSTKKQCKNKTKDVYCGLHIKKYTAKRPIILYKEVIIKLCLLKSFVLSDLYPQMADLFVNSFKIDIKSYPKTTYTKVYYLEGCKIIIQPLSVDEIY